jgi:DnaK suppressor protein
MNPQQIEYFRRRLLIWRSQLLDESEGSVSHPYKISEAQFDAISPAANLADQNAHLQSFDRRSKLLSKIDMALDHIEAGTYGTEQELRN